MKKVKIEIWDIDKLIRSCEFNEDYESLERVKKLKEEYELESLHDYVRLLEFISEMSGGDYRIYNHGTVICIGD